MKTLLFTIVLFSLSVGFTYGQQKRTSDETISLIFQLEQKHKELFLLPKSEDFIRDVIVVEVHKNREIICPNYPKRGQEHPEGNRGLFKDWITNHPDEYEDYINYLKEIMIKYRN